MLKILVKYIKYSGLWVGLVFNPLHWEFRFTTIQPDDLNPKAHGIFLTIGPVWIRGVIDDGSW
jgi:hypothetical protein